MKIWCAISRTRLRTSQEMLGWTQGTGFLPWAVGLPRRPWAALACLTWGSSHGCGLSGVIGGVETSTSWHGAHRAPLQACGLRGTVLKSSWAPSQLTGLPNETSWVKRQMSHTVWIYQPQGHFFCLLLMGQRLEVKSAILGSSHPSLSTLHLWASYLTQQPF